MPARLAATLQKRADLVAAASTEGWSCQVVPHGTGQRGRAQAGLTAAVRDDESTS